MLECPVYCSAPATAAARCRSALVLHSSAVPALAEPRPVLRLPAEAAADACTAFPATRPAARRSSLPRPCPPWSIRPPVHRPAALLSRAMLAEILHLLPLLRRQLAAKGQQETRIRFFQLRPRLCHLVDLGQNLAPRSAGPRSSAAPVTAPPSPGWRAGRSASPDAPARCRPSPCAVHR